MNIPNIIRVIPRVCLGKNSFVGSTVQNYKELRVLPFNLVYRKFAILWVVKIIDIWFDINISESKRKERAYNAIIAYTNSSFGQRFNLKKNTKGISGARRQYDLGENIIV